MSFLKRIKRIFVKSLFTITGDNINLWEFRKSGGIIGEICEIYNDVVFGSEPCLISIGNNVRITDWVRFVTHDGGLWTLRKMGLLENADYFGKISIGDNCHIGLNAIIMPNVFIRKNCVICCGTIMTKNIPGNSVAAGIPAKIIKNIEEYYKSHKDTCDYVKDLASK
jgi:acetyltransferase-like isoleucine patch superfamily enzyme